MLQCTRCKKPLKIPQGIQDSIDSFKAALTPTTNPTTQKFQYLYTGMLSTDQMNALGKYGWELVAIPFSSFNGTGSPDGCYWKRPV